MLCTRPVTGRGKVTEHKSVNNNTSLPIACSLSASDYAQRAQEFGSLFATALISSKREPTRLDLVLNRKLAEEARVRDLVDRERECCPYFTFEVASGAEDIRLQIEVPEGAEECLDDLEQIATRVNRVA
jgi:hypothetical protein